MNAHTTMRPISPAALARREAGFAVLFVFVMAAALAISLYAALPRVSFEAERVSQREQFALHFPAR